MSAPLVARGSTDTCIKCRHKFTAGDRIVVVHIVERIGVNPNNLRELGAWLSEEFELAHIDCANPSLTQLIQTR